MTPRRHEAERAMDNFLTLLDEHNKELRDPHDIRKAFREWSRQYQEEPWFDTLNDFINRMYEATR